MIKNILNSANKYSTGLEHVQHRRELWVKKSEEVKTHLKEIADYLNQNSTSKIGFFVDSSYAFDETINGACIEMPSITFRSGDLSMDLTFKNDDGNIITYAEKGFQITFSPSPTGEIIVMLLPHHNNLQTEVPKFITLTIISDLDKLTTDVVDEIVAKGTDAAFYSSFTGISELKDMPANGYNPVGFKRYETTEKPSDTEAES